MANKNKLTGKFIVAFDTLFEGNDCMKDDKGKPVLFRTHAEAFTEIFDSNHSMLSNRSRSELKEYNEGVTLKLVGEMGKVLKKGDVKLMEKFMSDHPECDDSGEFVVPAEEFIMNRKVVFGSEGFAITGTKLKS